MLKSRFVDKELALIMKIKISIDMRRTLYYSIKITNKKEIIIEDNLD